MKWWNRLEVRLTLLMVSVALLTNLITYGVTYYYNQQRFKELPSAVREFLQRDDPKPLPLDFSVQLSKRLSSGEKLVVQLLPADPHSGSQVMLLQSLSNPNQPVEQVIPAPRSSRGGSFRSRLQQGLLLGAVISALLGILLALVFARRLARPLEAVSKITNRLAQGDLTARIPEPRSQDETALLARNFNRMAASLEGLEQARKAMIADIAHELRTPLTVMQGRLEAIQDGVVPLEMLEIDRLHHQTQLLSRLVEDLRTLSLADTGKLTLLRRPLDLGEVLGAMSSFQAQAQSKGIALETPLPSRPLWVNADPDRMVQVISNLLTNALTHTPPGGTIRLSAGLEGNEAVLKVQDSGPGIPPEALNKIFDRFYRAEGSRSRATGGSGLGLAIVKALVELHGGRVNAFNPASGGAEFQVRLPLLQQEGAQEGSR
ncbi:sensor histidine kinase [Meiothermus granaticius]|uniref:histidine kinase n=2 Tax=Meiothermus TaxID=65551 RepID=A0A399FDW9_9DEIN|nr:ATP-binding protein [Meiothermus granaticius]RIH93222.1 Signal transduction histidine-protein kinase BaeS [Meiothermus granaticius NBRC 107808]